MANGESCRAMHVLRAGIWWDEVIWWNGEVEAMYRRHPSARGQRVLWVAFGVRRLGLAMPCCMGGSNDWSGLQAAIVSGCNVVACVRAEPLKCVRDATFAMVSLGDLEQERMLKVV